LSQRRHDKNKVYSIHAQEAECISKGKAHKKYEFGCKVSVVATSRECFIMGMKVYHGNPYDGHTLDDAVLQTESITGFKAKEVYVDHGYRGHNYRGEAEVRIAGRGRKRFKINQSNLPAFGIVFAPLTITILREIMEKRRRQRVFQVLKILYYTL